jgi:hypothetical protein
LTPCALTADDGLWVWKDFLHQSCGLILSNVSTRALTAKNGLINSMHELPWFRLLARFFSARAHGAEENRRSKVDALTRSVLWPAAASVFIQLPLLTIVSVQQRILRRTVSHASQLAQLFLLRSYCSAKLALEL